MRARTTFIGALAGLIALASVTASAPTAEAKKPTGSIVVMAKGFKSDEGKMIVVLFDKKDGFPMKLPNGIAVRDSKISSGKASVTFADIAPGQYAAVLFHDANGNRKIDTNWIGIPKEGVAASNNAEGTLGPPKWKDAKFSVAGAKVKQKLKVIYL